MFEQQEEVLTQNKIINPGNLFSCTACGSTNTNDFYEVKNQPAHVCVLLNSHDEAKNAPTGDITLSYCFDCGFIHNRVFDISKVTYQPGYEASLIHSAVFRSFLNGVASRLIDRYDIREKTVLEIGCGAGEFLRLICQLGSNNGIGIDPTIKEEVVEKTGEGTIQLIRDYFSYKYADIPFDFICCLSVFEQIPGPYEFLKSLRNMIGKRKIGIYFEVFNVSHAFRNRETWSIIYEQCNYYTPQSIPGLFERCGFKVLDSDTCYEGDQYLYVEAQTGDWTPVLYSLPLQQNNQLPREISEFSKYHRENIIEWEKRLEQFKNQGKRVVVWGSGGKGINFLNTLETESCISYVVDINPSKQRKYIPGSAQEIVSPQFLVEYRPDIIIITNPLYEKEIKAQVEELGISCSYSIA